MGLGACGLRVCTVIIKEVKLKDPNPPLNAPNIHVASPKKFGTGRPVYA